MTRNPAPGEGATIHDVARLAGVSISTVSNVLNGRLNRMRSDTCDRVRKVIAELRYAPNLTARELKTGFVPILGLIVPSVANPFWGSFATCLEHAAMARNCQIILCNSERDLDREQRYAEAMLARGIRGMILGSSPLTVTHLVDLAKRGLQVVAFDRDVQAKDGLELDSVRVDNVLGARMATEHLLELGHRRIAFVSGPMESANRVDRLKGYRDALQQAGIEPRPEWVWDSAPAGEPATIDNSGMEIGRAAAHALLALPEPPTAFFGVNDLTALGLYAGLRECGRQVPTDVSVMGFDDIDLCRVVTPALTTVRQPLGDIMKAAVELLLGRLDGSNAEPACHRTFQPELVVRGSTAARSGA